MSTPLRTSPPPAGHRARPGPSLVGAVTALVVALVLMAAPARAGAPPETSDDLVVATTHGKVRGRLTGDHRVFQGIPFAAAPVGDLRFRSPQPAEPWGGVLDATQRRSTCAQVYTWPPGSPPQFAGSEDCLYLNVHVPRTPAPKPVMVFFHGGGFTTGAGDGYDPRRMTGPEDVIVVTINYRLGALGFMRHPALRDRASGNFGIADQQAALRWVRRNIARFGGDAGNVTVWGESAGAYSVCAQLASPAARGLFDKAIVQSAVCANDVVTRPEADRRGREAAAALGCPDLRSAAACLRDADVEALAAVHTDVRFARDIATLPWLPVARTPLLPLQPSKAVRTGMGTHVPLLIGGTRDEMRTLLIDQYDGVGAPLTASAYRDVVIEFYGDDAPAVLAEYPPTTFASPSLALATLLSDEGRFLGACTQVRYADAARRRAPVFLYEFAEPSGRSSGDFPHGAHHGADVPYFFDSYDRPPTTRPPAQEHLAERLIEDWTTFARTGAPSGDWPTHGRGAARQYTSARIGPVDLVSTHRCGFWDAL